MSATKRQLCEDAFGELALAGHTFDLTPEEMQTALRRLDQMMARWDADGIRVGYALSDPVLGSGLDDASGLPAGAQEVVYQNLAVRLAAVFGKNLAPQTVTSAKAGYEDLLGRAVAPRPVQMSEMMPVGAGNERCGVGNPFFPPPNTGPLYTPEGGGLGIKQD